MRNIYLFILLYLFAGLGLLSAQGQWIDFNRDYFKIETAEDGIYSVNYTAFSAAGVSLAQVDPRDIRLYHRGEEVPVRILGEENGRFDPGDRILFYGKRNDATLDARLYTQPEDMPTPYYNTHNDTTAYFLTITPGVRGLRMATLPAPNLAGAGADRYQAERLQLFHNQYSLGPVYNPGIWMSDFERGQGWMGPVISRGNHLDYSFTNLDAIGGGTYRVEMNIIGRGGNDHVTSISAGPNAASLRELGRVNFPLYDVKNVAFDLAFSDFNSDGSILIRVRSVGGTSEVDNVSLSFVKLNYTKRVASGDFDRKELGLEPGVDRVQVPGVSGDYLGLEISDRDRPRQLSVQKQGDVLHVPGAGNGGASLVFVQNVNDIRNVDRMQRFRFRNVVNQAADYVLISHQSLRRPAASYGDPVAAYAAYRASAAGGGFDTLTVNMDQLYNQFSFGEKTPLAIYEFMRQYYPRHKPDYLLLLGRALGMFSTKREGGVTYNYRQNPSIFDWQDLVPPAGYPYADNNYVQNLDPEAPAVQAVPVGRVPARNPDEVASYLDKVKEKEALGVQEAWQKNIAHLSGGVSAVELNRYFNFLNGFKNIAEDVYLGGAVKTFRKRSTATVELINISEEVNQGTSLITFFGHASPSLIDIEIGFATDPQMGYANKGKYPVLLLNGCDAGNAYGTAYTFGEDWTLARDAGASHFIAHSNLGVDIYLRRYSESFYLKAFSDSSLIHQSIGKVRVEAEKHMFNRYGTGPIYRSHASMMVMLGDPANKIFPANKADYAINGEEVTLEGYDPGSLNVMQDTLNLKFVVRNLGRVDLDSFTVNVSRKIPDGTVIQYERKVLPPVFRKDTISFPIPNKGLEAFGENFFTIELNPDRRVEELTYMNNSVTVSEFIRLNGTTNLMPLAFSIVDSPSATLVSQVSTLSSESRSVMFQMDTVPTFNSSVRRETRVQTTGLAKWELDFSGLVGGKDSLTVYWRTRFLEPREGEDEDWAMSSFSYISQNPEGWTQRHLPQFRGSGLFQLEIDEPRREWKFEGVDMDIKVVTFGNQTPSLTYENTEFFMDGIPYILSAGNRLCPNGSLGLVSFQQKDLTPYLVFPPIGFDVLDGRMCGRVPQIIQSIRNNNLVGGNQMLLDYIDGVGDGDYVIVFSVGNVTFSDWPDAAFEKMKEFGANEATLRNLKSGDPYILFGRKGMKPGEAIEIVADRNHEEPTNAQILDFETKLEGHFTSGSIISPRIGPAREWGALFQYIKNTDLFNQEMTSMDLIGVTAEGNEVVLMEKLYDKELALSSVNAQQYPFLRLKYSLDDPEAEKPSQLGLWQVNYTGVPEGVLLFHSAESRVQMREGEERALKFEFANISKHDFQDSVTVEWTFSHVDSRKVEKYSKKIPAVEAGQSYPFEVVFNSSGKPGKTNVNVFANPRMLLEQSYQNNVSDLPGYFTVLPDDSNPVLDVNFDGVYIMDGDIVSPTVMISARLKDINSLMLKKDTTGVEVSLRKNCETCVFERVNFSSPKLKYFAATEESDYKIEFQPGPLEDGKYTLRINASNAAGNQAGEKPYEINFEVVNEAQITNFYPYPNPFSSSVRFVFTVTGSQVPDQIKIQIMTVTGKVVREILQDELGPLRIGNNMTEYAWDGKDEFGDQLANGVYIYRVLVMQNGQFMEHRATAGDKAFKKGYGKMYLLR